MDLYLGCMQHVEVFPSRILIKDLLQYLSDAAVHYPAESKLQLPTSQVGKFLAPILSLELLVAFSSHCPTLWNTISYNYTVPVIPHNHHVFYI